MYVWHIDGQVLDHNMQTGDVTGKVIKVADQGEADNQVLCAYAFDGMHIMGTSVS